jgi:single-stranded-DNA-specific exonuclease
MLSWRLKVVRDDCVDRLVKELGVTSTTARCLVSRGMSDVGRAAAFLRPRLSDLRPPDTLAGLPEAAARLATAVTQGEHIGVFGDYDVDGVTTTALLCSFLRGLGATVSPRVAQRRYGYGFGERDSAWFADQACRVVVTVDCGTSDVPALLHARERGIDVIVVDHHQVPGRSEHPSLALVNPHRPDSSYPFRGLASVGLGFFLAAAVRTTLRTAGFFGAARSEPDVRALLDLVSVGTIADMAPLCEENRVLVAAGLRELSLRRRPGLSALLAAAGVESTASVDEMDVGWKIGPRLNAPGRMDDAAPALALLLCEDPAEARRLAQVCEDENLRRRALQDRALSEAVEAAAPFLGEPALVVAHEDWHPGVVGIVAAKLVERFGKPTAVIALGPDGQGRGSVRTARGVDVYGALCACESHLVKYGGHKAAAGLTVARANLQDFRQAFSAAVGAVSEADAERPLELDALVELGDVNDSLVEELGALGPFGQGNEAPRLGVRGVRVEKSRRVGGDRSHLQLTLGCAKSETSHAAIAFGMGALDPGAGAHVDAAFFPEVSHFRGQRQLKLKISALRVTDAIRGEVDPA